MTILRIYEPSECDAAGVPMDWDCCRGCRGLGGFDASGVPSTAYSGPLCPVCCGAGSLKLAALASRLMRFRGATAIPADEIRHRCESCSHPMSEGTREPIAWGGYTEDDRRMGLTDIREGRHYSACDSLCTHGGPVRFLEERLGSTLQQHEVVVEGAIPRVMHLRPEASWRSVDVRTLGWPHDLRPERLAVLCLRCFAGRDL